MLVFTVTGEVASACPEGLQTPILSRASRSLLRQVVYYMFRTIYCTERALSNKLDLPLSNSPTHEVLACGGPPQLPL